MSHSKECNHQTRDTNVQLVNNGPPRSQHYNKDRGASVIPKICWSASSLTTVEVGPRERPYHGCMSSLKASSCHRKGASSWGVSSHPPVEHELAMCELAPHNRMWGHYLQASTPNRMWAHYVQARSPWQGASSPLHAPSSLTVSWRPLKGVSRALTLDLHSYRLVTCPSNLPQNPTSINLV